MHELCREIQDALADAKSAEALHVLLDRIEINQTATMREVYDALMSFLPTEDEARYDVIADELDTFTGWCHESCWRWASEPRIEDTVATPWPTRVIIGVVGVWQDSLNRYLIGRRAGKAYTGCWEFPGGKREHPETNEAALIREWKEELDTEITVGPRLFTGKFTTVDLREFCALAFQVTDMKGTPKPGVAHSEFAWRTKREILDLPEAEVTPSLKPITQALRW